MSIKKLVSPVIILVEPQLPENIGFSARAMFNFGITKLRLVNPQESWPNEKAISTSAGALESKKFGLEKIPQKGAIEHNGSYFYNLIKFRQI